jgi:hypothetical protein
MSFTIHAPFLPPFLHPGLARLRALADAELEGARRDRTAAHVERCARCRGELAWLAEARRVLRAPDAARAPADAWARIGGRRRQPGQAAVIAAAISVTSGPPTSWLNAPSRQVASR